MWITLMLTLVAGSPQSGETPLRMPSTPPQRQPAASADSNPAQQVERALTELESSLKAWRAALERGDQEMDPETFHRLVRRAEGLMEDIHYLHSAAELKEAAQDAEFHQVQRTQPLATSQRVQWIEAMHRLGKGSAEARQQTVRAWHAALDSNDPAQQREALGAIGACGDIAFDKAPLAKKVRALTERLTGHDRVSAFYALHATGHEPADLGRVHAAYAKGDAEMRMSVVHLLFLFGKADLSKGRSDQILLERLRDPSTKMRSIALHPLWGAKISDAAAQQVLKLTQHRDHELRHDAVYYALTTLQPKNPAVVDFLLDEVMQHRSQASRALWGLSYGVLPAQQSKVAEAMVELHNARSEWRTRKEAGDLVRRYGSAEQIARLLQK